MCCDGGDKECCIDGEVKYASRKDDVTKGNKLSNAEECLMAERVKKAFTEGRTVDAMIYNEDALLEGSKRRAEGIIKMPGARVLRIR